MNYRKGYAESFRMAGIAYYKDYDYPNCITNLEKSLLLFKQLNDSVNFAKVLLNIGNTYFWDENYQVALDYYELSHSW